jgi:2-dehydropantoate 2-reductase
MRHGILGAGGVGGMIAAVLADAGDDVTIIVRPGTESRYPARITLESTLGKIEAPVLVRASLDRPVDVLWITIKATQLDEALAEIPRGSATLVVPLLNGIDHIDELRQRFGADAVIAATIAVESERVAPGHIVHRSPFARVNLSSRGKKSMAAPVEQLRRFGIDCKFVDDERTLMWSKLALLAPIALSTTAMRAPIGQVRDDPSRSKLLEGCVREVCAVGKAEGATLDPDAIIATIRGVVPTMRSSMQKDLEAGNPLELAAIGGPILSKGQAHGVSVPATAELIRQVEENQKRRG